MLIKNEKNQMMSIRVDIKISIVNNLLQVTLTPLAQQLVKKTITTYFDNHLFITVIF